MDLGDENGGAQKSNQFYNNFQNIQKIIDKEDNDKTVIEMAAKQSTEYER